MGCKMKDMAVVETGQKTEDRRPASEVVGVGRQNLSASAGPDSI